MMEVAMDDNKQIDRFKETARKLGCDEDEEAFDEKLKAVVGPQPKPKAEKLTSRGTRPRSA